jgi:ribosome-binding protein aMBF1 (putative translation factor)
MKKSKNTISSWLKKHGDPEIDKFVEKNLAITEKVRLALEAKGWNKGDLANAMDKNPSEVTKWLSGMHNLTLKSIIKMEQALGIDLFHCEPIKEFEYVFLGMIQNDKDFNKKKKDYIDATEMSEYSVAM